MAMITAVRLVIFTASAVALGLQRTLRVRRRAQEEGLALVSTPELRNVGCQRLCVPSRAAGDSERVRGAFVVTGQAPGVRFAAIRPMKVVGQFRTAASRPNRSISRSSETRPVRRVICYERTNLRLSRRGPVREN